MKNELWYIWLYDEIRREYDFNKYVFLKKVKLVNENNGLILGHLEKAVIT